MIKRILGRTGFEVSALGLGCFQFTGEFGVHPDVSEELVDFAIKSGINLFDTAEMYGFGESEEIVARGAYNNPDKRIYISTKVGYLDDRTVTRTAGLNAYVNPVEIKRAIKHSLWLLRQDHFDMMLIHEPNIPQWGFNYETGDCVVLSVLEEMKKSGLVANIGLGCWDHHISAMLVKTGRIDAVLAAGGMSLLSRPMFDELIPEAQKQNTGIMLGGGFGQNNPNLVTKNRAALPEMLASDNPMIVAMAKKLEKIYDIADELNTSMTELAIRYILSFDEVHAHCAGAREVAHVKSNIEAANKGPLDKEYVDRINKIQTIA